MTDWDAVRREEFAALDGHGIYLNAASIGPLPARSVAILAACNRDRARPHLWPVDRVNSVLSESRWMCGRLINAEEQDLALMPNTTTGLNVAARALPLRSGDIVLAFDKDFPAVMYPWMMRAGEGVVLERIPCTPEGWPDEARLHERLRDPAVRAVCVSLTQFANGYTIDLDALSRATRELEKWLVVDAIQACGQVPIDIIATPVDFLACGAQKWLLSPWGTGFLYVRRELITTFEPTFAGWAAFEGSDDYTQLTAYDPRPWPDARRFELLTFPVQDFAAMNASLGLILGIGVGAIAERLRELHVPMVEAADRAGFRVTSPRGARGSGILCLAPPAGHDPARMFEQMQRAGVVCSLREGSVRLSPHVYTEQRETDQVGELL